jgi:hypothetical protein
MIGAQNKSIGPMSAGIVSYDGDVTFDVLQTNLHVIKQSSRGIKQIFLCHISFAGN